MSEVTRYAFELNHPNGGDMSVDPYGTYVDYEDYAALQQLVNQLAAENAAMLEAINNTIGWQESVDAENTESTRALRELKPNPHTDAFLLNAQAVGLDKFAKESYALNRLHFERRDSEAAIAADSRGMMASIFADDLRAQAEELQKGGV